MTIKITIADAVRSLLYKANVGVSTAPLSAHWFIEETDNYDTLVWEDTDIPKPTKEEIDAEIDRLTKEHNYKEFRSENYPSISEQLDMLWHSMDKGEIPKSESFYKKLADVKENYIKPSMEILPERQDALGDGLVFTEGTPPENPLTEEDYKKMLEG